MYQLGGRLLDRGLDITDLEEKLQAEQTPDLSTRDRREGLQPVASGRRLVLARKPLAALQGLARQERANAGRRPAVVWLDRGVRKRFLKSGCPLRRIFTRRVKGLLPP
jgi:hypothetical protein